MSRFWLFESGGTKTSVLCYDQGGTRESELPAFNPNREHQEFLNSLQDLDIISSDQVVFYGSGLADPENQRYVQDIFFRSFNVTPSVYHDLTGAARALLGEEQGIVMIAGTGAIAGWYNGREVVDRKGGHGYLIDDIGGGLELGKLVVSQWLNGRFSGELEKMIGQLAGATREHFTTHFYQNPQLALFSQMTELIGKNQEDPLVREMLQNYFDLFFRRHLSDLLKTYQRSEVYCCGSVAYYFQNAIREAFSRQGISVSKVIQKPAHELLAFHVRKGFSTENETI